MPWIGSPGMKCGSAQSTVTPMKNATTYVMIFLVRYRRTAWLQLPDVVQRSARPAPRPVQDRGAGRSRTASGYAIGSRCLSARLLDRRELRQRRNRGHGADVARPHSRDVLVAAARARREVGPVLGVALEPDAVVPERDLRLLLQEVLFQRGVDLVQLGGVGRGDAGRLLHQVPVRRR